MSFILTWDRDPAHHRWLKAALSLLILKAVLWLFMPWWAPSQHWQSPRAVLLMLAADSSRSYPASLCIKTAFRKQRAVSLWCLISILLFHLHFRECLISFHFEFFIVTLCQCPICQRARKSHYSYTCGKAAHLYWLLWSIQTSSGIDPSFLCLYKVIILPSDC